MFVAGRRIGPDDGRPDIDRNRIGLKGAEDHRHGFRCRGFR